MTINRQEVYDKFNGLCGYSGTPLEYDWQIDHIVPKKHSWLINFNNTMTEYNPKLIDQISNLVPCQRRINHYKRGLLIDDKFNPKWNFRYRIMNLHSRIQKLPKNPRTEYSIKLKYYLLKIAEYFNVTTDNPFDGWFYFEKVMLSEWFKME